MIIVFDEILAFMSYMELLCQRSAYFHALIDTILEVIELRKGKLYHELLVVYVPLHVAEVLSLMKILFGTR